MINKENFMDIVRWLLCSFLLAILLVNSCRSGNENVSAVSATDTEPKNTEPKKMCEIDTGIRHDDSIYQTTVDECQYLVALSQKGSISIIHKQNCNNPQLIKEEKNNLRHKQILEHDCSFSDNFYE